MLCTGAASHLLVSNLDYTARVTLALGKNRTAQPKRECSFEPCTKTLYVIGWKIIVQREATTDMNHSFHLGIRVIAGQQFLI